MVGPFLRMLRSLIAFQEFLVLAHLAPFVRALRIEPLHLELLVPRELREMTDETDEVPACALALLGAISKAGHPREPDAVPDDVEQLAVREALRRREPQIRHARIKIAS